MADFVSKFPDFLKPWGEEMLLRYVDFEGTTERKKYWIVFLTDFILGIIFFFLGFIPIIGKVLSTVFGLGLVIPRVAKDVRRLRDTGKSWAFMFLWFVPFVGPIILLVFMCQE